MQRFCSFLTEKDTDICRNAAVSQRQSQDMSFKNVLYINKYLRVARYDGQKLLQSAPA